MTTLNRKPLQDAVVDVLSLKEIGKVMLWIEATIYYSWTCLIIVLIAYKPFWFYYFVLRVKWIWFRVCNTWFLLYLHIMIPIYIIHCLQVIFFFVVQRTVVLSWSWSLHFCSFKRMSYRSKHQNFSERSSCFFILTILEGSSVNPLSWKNLRA